MTKESKYVLMPKPAPLTTNKGVSELARKAGISITTASRKLGSGKTPEEIIDEAEAYRAKQKHQAEKPGSGETKWEAETRKERALADQNELKAAELKGELVRKAEVNIFIAGMIISARNILMRIGPELRDRLSQESDPIKIESMIETEVRRALAELAEFKA